MPHSYDLINRLVTLGLDRRWRLEAARECLGLRPAKLLDLCCGTGDLALAVARLSKRIADQPAKRLARGDAELTGVDYSQPMLEIAAHKARRFTAGRRISFVHGDVAALPFPDEHFDCVGISFGFRNLTYKNLYTRRYLAEILRVLKTGGRFIIIESSQPESTLIRRVFHLYLRSYVYGVGYLISRDRRAYHYMVESMTRFYQPQELKLILLGAGFRNVSFRRRLLGAVSLHAAVK